MLSGEATNTNLIVFGLTQPGAEPKIYRTRGEHANHYASDAVQNVLIDRFFFVFNATFSTIMATSFSGGRSRSTQRELSTMSKQLVNFYHLRLRV